MLLLAAAPWMARSDAPLQLAACQRAWAVGATRASPFGAHSMPRCLRMRCVLWAIEAGPGEWCGLQAAGRLAPLPSGKGNKRVGGLLFILNPAHCACHAVMSMIVPSHVLYILYDAATGADLPLLNQGRRRGRGGLPLIHCAASPGSLALSVLGQQQSQAAAPYDRDMTQLVSPLCQDWPMQAQCLVQVHRSYILLHIPSITAIGLAHNGGIMLAPQRVRNDH